MPDQPCPEVHRFQPRDTFLTPLQAQKDIQEKAFRENRAKGNERGDLAPIDAICTGRIRTRGAATEGVAQCLGNPET